MASDTIYKSPDGEKVLMEIYDRQLESLDIEYDSGIIQTRFGHTHVISAGNKKGKPVMIIAAGRDVIFPGRKVLKRAEEIFANLERPVLLDESSHMYFNVKSDRDNVNRFLEGFFN